MKVILKLLTIIASIVSLDTLQATDAVNDPAINQEILQNVTQYTVNVPGVSIPGVLNTDDLEIQLNDDELNCFDSIKYWQNPNNMPVEQQNHNNTNYVPDGTPMTTVFEKYKKCAEDILYLNYVLSMNNPAIQQNELNNVLNIHNITLNNNNKITQMSNVVTNYNTQKITMIKSMLLNLFMQLHYHVDGLVCDLNDEIQTNAQADTQDKALFNEWVKEDGKLLPITVYSLVLKNNQNTPKANLQIAAMPFKIINNLDNNNTFKNFIQDKVVESEQNNNDNAAVNNQLIAQ